jgi:hypothetical protein
MARCIGQAGHRGVCQCHEVQLNRRTTLVPLDGSSFNRCGRAPTCCSLPTGGRSLCVIGKPCHAVTSIKIAVGGVLHLSAVDHVWYHVVNVVCQQHRCWSQGPADRGWRSS